MSSGDDTNAFLWKWIGQGIGGDASNNQFACSISLSDNGKTLVVGAQYANGKNGEYLGIVIIYQMNDAKMNWIQIGNGIDGKAAYDKSGSLVFLSADGNKVAIGSPYNGDNGINSGHVRVFGLE